MTHAALTVRGNVNIEPSIPLADLNVGDFVLGTPTPDLEPMRTLYRVTKPYGNHRVPLEPPVSLLERVLSTVDGKCLGVLVELVVGEAVAEPFPAMFTEEHAPAVDRVTSFD